MKTPIYDFVKAYADRDCVRLHMPGHKGSPMIGCEPLDITEIRGADVLSLASGIIGESEAAASSLFGSAATLYSTEGSSACIKAMLALVCEGRCGARVLAARNVHRAFIDAVALLGIEVDWLYPERGAHLLSAPISPDRVAAALDSGEMPDAVYITSPDYLGGVADIRGIAAVCRARGVPLLVDNAHGAYLRFLSPSQHPISLGASLCCDSAHKTLSALTGAAYLHIAPGEERYVASARERLALFSSSSPSYLTLASLDLCNRYLENGYADRLARTVERLAALRARLRELGYTLAAGEPLKLVLCLDGEALAAYLSGCGIECEMADPFRLVLMVTPETGASDLDRLALALARYAGDCTPRPLPPAPAPGERAMSIRGALLAVHERIPLARALGRIAAAPTVSCPPAVPIVVSGERITEAALGLLALFGHTEVAVVRER